MCKQERSWRNLGISVEAGHGLRTVLMFFRYGVLKMGG